MTQGSIKVSCGYRIHVNSIDMTYSGSRVCGGVGIGLEKPRIVVVARSCQGLPSDPWAVQVVQRFKEVEGVGAELSVEVESPLESHKGLGSTTISTLCALAGLYRICKIPFGSAKAAQYGIGLTSGIGLYSFFHGGLIVDGGYKRDPAQKEQLNGERSGTPANLLFQLRLPRSWKALLAVPRSRQSLNGSAEGQFFRSITPVPDEHPARISYAILMELIPSIQARDFDGFTAALRSISSLGTKPHEVDLNEGMAGSLIQDMARIFGFASVSSLGPTVYSFASKGTDCELRVLARQYPDFRFVETEISERGLSYD